MMKAGPQVKGFFDAFAVPELAEKMMNRGVHPSAVVMVIPTSETESYRTTALDQLSRSVSYVIGGLIPGGEALSNPLAIQGVAAAMAAVAIIAAMRESVPPTPEKPYIMDLTGAQIKKDAPAPKPNATEITVTETK